jgi:hypothetical protein
MEWYSAKYSLPKTVLTIWPDAVYGKRSALISNWVYVAPVLFDNTSSTNLVQVARIENGMWRFYLGDYMRLNDALWWTPIEEESWGGRIKFDATQRKICIDPQP